MKKNYFSLVPAALLCGMQPERIAAGSDEGSGGGSEANNGR